MGKEDKANKGKNETTFTDVGNHSRNGQSRQTADTGAKKGYDPCRNGPKKNRSCTDILCCLIFFIFILGLGVVAVLAFVWGDPRLLIYPQDSDGNLCGWGSKENQKFLFFFDLTVCGRVGPAVFVKGCPTPQICVEKCPDKDYVFLSEPSSTDKRNLFCKYGIKENINDRRTVAKLVSDHDCAPYYFNSTPVINRCLPISDLLKLTTAVVSIGNQTLTDSQNNTIERSVINAGLDVYKQFLNAREFGEKIVADVVASWWMILIGLLVAMILSLIWIFLMRWLAGFMVWLTILAFVVIWVGLTAVCWYLYIDVKGTDQTLSFYLIWHLTFKKEHIFLAGGIIFGVISIIVLLILLFLCPRIRIAIALIKEASKAVGSMWSTLLWPLVPFVLQLGVVALWVCVATFLASIGRGREFGQNYTSSNGSLNYDRIREDTKDIFEKIPCDINDTTTGSICGFIKYGKGDYTIYMQVYNLFMLFWLVNFVAALGQLTLSGAYSSWYWAFEKPKDVPNLPLLGAFWISIRYHLGSLAFGSLLIAIVQIIRAFLEYLDNKMKASENPVAKFFLKCLKCCFWCLEKILRYICKNAFIMMAVYGKNFCRSAFRAMKLILKNCVRAFVLDKVTDFLLLVSKLVVVGATGVIAYFFFDGDIPYLSDYNPKLNFYLVPIIIVILGSYIIADIFFSVYEMAVDTIFLCFLEDIERNDGSQEKPYFMGKGLMKILGKSNFKVKDKKDS